MLQNVAGLNSKIDIQKVKQIKQSLEEAQNTIHQRETFTRTEDIISQDGDQIALLRKFANNKSQLIEASRDNKIDIIDFDETGEVTGTATQEKNAQISDKSSNKTFELKYNPSGNIEFTEKDDLSDAQLTTTLSSGHVYKGKVEVPGKKKLTVLFWGNGSGNIEPLVVRQLLDMEKLGSTKDMNIVAQISRAPQEEIKNMFGEDYIPSNIDGNWSKEARRYYVTKGEQEANPLPVIKQETIDSPVLENLGDVDMKDKKQLLDFLLKETKDFPAEHYMVVLFDHGQGWKGIAPDDDDKPLISPEDMGEITQKVKESTGQKIDVMVMENCLEGQAEALYPMRNNADYIVASPEVLWGSAFTDVPGPIHIREGLELIQKNERNELNNPKEAANDILMATANKHHAATLSVIDASKLGELADSVAGLKNSLQSQRVPGEPLKRIAQGTQEYELLAPSEGRQGFVDLGDLAENIEKAAANNRPIKEAAQNVKQALAKTVVSNLHMTGDKINCDSDDGSSWIEFNGNVQRCHGLSINLGLPGTDEENKSYANLSFTKDTGWNEVINNINWKPGEANTEN